jgi:4-hydroxybenzoate polyprenyltransferase
VKKIITEAVSVFFYCNFFIAACAASLVYETIHLLHSVSGNHWLPVLVFCCTVNIYTFHYYLKCNKPGDDKRLQWYRKYKPVVLALLVIGTLAIAYLIITHFNILFNKENISWSLLIPFLSIAYSFPFLPGGKALRHFGWLKLPLLSFVWSFTTVLLPVFFFIPGKIQPEVWILFANRFFFIMALAMLFNIRDYEEDKRDNVITPVVALGIKKILRYGKWLMIFLNLVTALLVCSYFNLHLAYQYFAVIVPVLLLFLLFHYFRFGRNEIQFLALHDGLMPVKALLLIFATGI